MEFVNKIPFINKKVSFLLKNEVRHDSNDCIEDFCLSFLRTQLYINNMGKESIIYNCFVNSLNDVFLSKILRKYCNTDIDVNDIQRLIQQYPDLAHLNVGQVLYWLIIGQKKLQCLIWGISIKEVRIYNQLHTAFTEDIIKIFDRWNKRDELCKIVFISKIHETFMDSARSLGLEKNCILEIIHALQYRLDFQKLQKGDKFSILVSTRISNENNTLKYKLIGARLHTAGKDYYLFRANNNKFYDKNAVKLGEKCPIRLPLAYPYRISSKFNLNRLHPITGRISPHSGVDFAVPIGTPVLSAGDGKVIISSYKKSAGNYVVIQHNYQIVTRYFHLKKILVTPGQKVKRGDYIALSGNTGLSTGPHLHFEIWINHQPVNPLTFNLLNFERLLGKERVYYLNQICEIIPKLSFD